MSPIQLSLEVASTALVLVVLWGLFLNFLMKRYDFPGKSLLDSLVTLPLVLPPVVVGFLLLMVFSPGAELGGWLDRHGLGVVFTKAGAVIASAIISFPLFYQSLRSALASVDESMEDVARTLGASEVRIFFTISLPLAWKGTVSGGILAFTRGLGEFGATILIAGNIPGVTRTMPLAIYSLVELGDYEGAFEVVLYICMITLVLLWLVHGLSKGVFQSSRR